jgi:segregation and condensation protein A
MAYNVKINVFEGPFDLLLHLVRLNEMDIYDIPIAEIANQYLDYIKEMEKLDLEIAGDFLVMAATLINLKSRALMPPLGEEEDEEEEIDEDLANIRDAQELMRRLIEYRQFKEIAVTLSEREEEQLRLFYRNTVLPVVTEEGQSQEAREEISLLFSAFARVLDYADGRPAHHVVEEEFSVEEKIDYVTEQVNAKRRLSLADLVRRCINKNEVIALFLALLEICRLRLARVRQAGSFQEIYIVHPSEPEDDEE